MIASKVTLAVLFEKAIGSKLQEINSMFFFLAAAADQSEVVD